MANCTDCSGANIVLTGNYFPGSPCIDNSDCGGATYNALCVYYNGPNLSCSGIDTLDSLEVALQKLDEKICEVVGDYSTYTMNCLPDWWEASITTQAEFVDAITAYACDLQDQITEFIDTTYAADQTALDVRLDALEVPGITCASASVVNTDTLQQVLTKYCTKFTSLTTAIDISSVTWDECLVVVGTPSTIAEGFQLLSDQICELYDQLNDGGTLPVFNNYGSCIGGSSSDSLVTTIGLIKDRLCLTDTFDVDNITFGCVGDGTETSLEDAIQAIVDELNVLLPAAPTFDPSDFTVTATDPMDACAGVTISLASPAVQDRFVASNASDTDPGTLIDKLISGGSIAFDDSTNEFISVDIADDNFGDITTSSTGSVWTINNDAVTFAKMQNINTGILLGRSTASSGNVEEISIGDGLDLSGGVLSSTIVVPTVESGFYTPTITEITNVAASTAYSCVYMRVGDIVTVAGQVDIDATAAGSTELWLSFPSIDTSTTGFRIGGTAVCQTVEGLSAGISLATAGAGAKVKFVTTDTGNNQFFFTFTYEVIPP